MAHHAANPGPRQVAALSPVPAAQAAVASRTRGRVRPTRGPISMAKATVPTPTVPPIHQPATSTEPSMPVRTAHSGQPVRACNPVIRPSRGPGPKRAPMYRPVASASTSRPPAKASACCQATANSGSSHSPNCALGPMSNTLSTVPRPGRCRSGHHNSSTAMPIRLVSRPKPSPVCRARPWVSTSQGATPSPARSIRLIARPYRNSPPSSLDRRSARRGGRGMARLSRRCASRGVRCTRCCVPGAAAAVTCRPVPACRCCGRTPGAGAPRAGSRQ